MAKILKQIIFLVVVCYFVLNIAGFVLNEECQKSLLLTCSCGVTFSFTPPTSYFLINCNGYPITEVPPIQRMDITQASLTLNFCCNRISRIPANAFSNLHFSVAQSTVFVDFHTSALTDIDINAFNGIESLVTSVNLNNNHLTQIPAAIGNLHNLQSLIIRENPLATVDPSVTSGLAHSLTYLELDMDHFQSWPTSFGNLAALQTLKMSHVKRAFRGINIFNGFAHTLKELFIDYAPTDHGAGFHAIPEAVTKLTALHDLTIGAHIYCTCDLAYLKAWHPPAGFDLFYPNCANTPNTRVVHYLSTSLKLC